MKLSNILSNILGYHNRRHLFCLLQLNRSCYNLFFLYIVLTLINSQQSVSCLSELSSLAVLSLQHSTHKQTTGDCPCQICFHFLEILQNTLGKDFTWEECPEGRTQQKMYALKITIFLFTAHLRWWRGLPTRHVFESMGHNTVCAVAVHL